jgi:hypothetical protein
LLFFSEWLGVFFTEKNLIELEGLSQEFCENVQLFGFNWPPPVRPVFLSNEFPYCTSEII